jgi:hypothetical protein
VSPIEGKVTTARNQLNIHFIVMQDGPAYLLIKILTIDELHERGTYPID